MSGDCFHLGERLGIVDEALTLSDDLRRYECLCPLPGRLPNSVVRVPINKSQCASCPQYAQTPSIKIEMRADAVNWPEMRRERLETFHVEVEPDDEGHRYLRALRVIGNLLAIVAAAFIAYTVLSIYAY